MFGFYDDLEVYNPDAGSSTGAKDHADETDVRCCHNFRYQAMATLTKVDAQVIACSIVMTMRKHPLPKTYFRSCFCDMPDF